MNNCNAFKSAAVLEQLIEDAVISEDVNLLKKIVKFSRYDKEFVKYIINQSGKHGSIKIFSKYINYLIGILPDDFYKYLGNESKHRELNNLINERKYFGHRSDLQLMLNDIAAFVNKM